jgi:hypothetical protein
VIKVSWRKFSHKIGFLPALGRIPLVATVLLENDDQDDEANKDPENNDAFWP